MKQQVGKEFDPLLTGGKHYGEYDGVEKIPNEPPPPTRFQQGCAFFLVFIGYLFTQAARKALSNVKSSLMKTWTAEDTEYGGKISVQHDIFDSEDSAESYLGILDALFMLGYAISLFIAGRLGDSVDAHKLFACGMFFSGIMLFLFGCVTEWLCFYSIACVRVLAEWFPRLHYGKVIGLYALSYPIGRTAGSYMSSAVIDYGYEYVFLLHSGVMIGLGFVEYFGLVGSPRDIAHHEPPPLPKKLTPWKILLLPGVLAYSLSYAGIKMVNYAITFWLPLYCTEELGWSEKVSDELSTWFDVGGIFGTLFVGLAWDKIPKGRNVLLVLLMFIAAALLYGYSETPAIVVLNCIVLFFCGIFHWAVYNAQGAIASTALAPKTTAKGLFVL